MLGNKLLDSFLTRVSQRITEEGDKQTIYKVTQPNGHTAGYMLTVRPSEVAETTEKEPVQ